MLSSDSRFRPNLTDVAAKVIDGEAIIMNLSNGLYFSMENVGAAVWELTELGHSLGEIIDILQDRSGMNRGTIEQDVYRLAEELIREGLVLQSDEGASDSEMPSPTLEPLAYTPPTLNKYTDMADILALDPPMPGLGESTWDG
jgi:hypothetical protein